MSASKPKQKTPDRQWRGSTDLEPFLVPIGDVMRDPANVRRHGEKNLSSIRASLSRFGQQRPVLIDAHQVIRAGNGTHEAAELLGWSHIAVVRTELAGSEATAYAIADNRTSELAEWDDQALAETLRSLQSENFDLAAAGYADEEVNKLIDGLASAFEADADALEADFQSKSRSDAGQLELRFSVVCNEQDRERMISALRAEAEAFPNARFYA